MSRISERSISDRVVWWIGAEALMFLKAQRCCQPGAPPLKPAKKEDILDQVCHLGHLRDVDVCDLVEYDHIGAGDLPG
jgi:hypothetical protein